MKNPLILDIRGNSLDDGPGIRTVVFFKGCPLSCAWCHNPESKHHSVELAFNSKECVGCNTCMQVCEKKAISRKHEGFIDRTKCARCFQCADVCPSGALFRVGKEMRVSEIMEIVIQDLSFYKNSGGGVTISGGEPTIYMDFSSQLLRECKKKKINTLLETCGYFDWDEFETKILPWIDMVYYDIKLIDPMRHKEYCGVSNQRILENFRKLAASAEKRKINLLARTPLVPGITDTSENLSSIAYFLAAHGISKASLLSYNPMWRQKCEQLGIHNHHRKNQRIRHGDGWMSKERIEECKRIFLQAGIAV